MQNCGSIDYSQDTDGTITLAGTKRIRRLVSCSLANQHKYEICDLCPTSASSGFVNTFQKKSLKYQSHHLTSISKKCYISGGVGALGQLVASWYSKHTSLNTILLAARSGRTHKARSVWHDGALLACLTRNDIATTEDAVSCDDHDFSDFVHTGGILNDLALHDQNTLSFVTSMSPKVHGLRKFVPGSTPCKATTRTILFSSIAALLGSSGQANYCAANSCLDTWALSTMHSGAGGVTNSVQWGAWRSVGGMASENPSVLSRLDRLGFGSLTPKTGLRALQAAIFSLTHVQNRVICINPFDWKRFFANLHRPTKFFQEIETVADSHAATSDAVKEISTLSVKEISTLSSEDIAKHSQVVKVDLHSTIISAVRVILGRDVGQEEPFVDAGIDSLSSVELRNGLVNSPTLIAAFGADRLKEYVPATVVFDFPNVSVLSTHLSQYCEPEVKTTVEFFELASEDVHDDKVALSIENIVGELPAITKYSHIASDALGLISGDRWQVDDESAPTARFGGILEEIEKFDASIFHITHVEALYIDPQHRSLLKLALESVSQQLTSFDMDQSSTGVAVGISGNEYAQLCNASVAVSPYTALGGFMSVSCGRLSYTFGFGGMSFAVDTACSSGLVATHLAAANIRNIGGKTRQMLCAAANVTLLPTTTNMFVVSHMIASDGRCKTFDVTAAGYVRSEAAVTSILQYISNIDERGEYYCAILAGSATNQDGRSSSLTAPNGPAQQRVIRSALLHAQEEVSRLNFLEMHGTGTSLGDPIEVNAAVDVFGDSVNHTSPLCLTAAKSRTGHAEPASGMIGLYSAISTGSRSSLSQNMHLRQLNPHIEQIISRRRGLFGTPRQTPPIPLESSNTIRSGVSAFAFQGTNVHVTLSSQPAISTFTRAILLYDSAPFWVARHEHPMIESALTHTLTESVSSIRFTARLDGSASIAHILDHQVLGMQLFPAAGFLELVSAAFNESIESLQRSLSEFQHDLNLCAISIPSPFVLANVVQTCFVALDPTNGVTTISSTLGMHLVANARAFSDRINSQNTSRSTDLQCHTEPMVVLGRSYGVARRDVTESNGVNSTLAIPPALLDAIMQLAGARQNTSQILVPAGFDMFSIFSNECATYESWGSAREMDSNQFKTEHILGSTSGKSIEAMLSGMEMRPAGQSFMNLNAGSRNAYNMASDISRQIFYAAKRVAVGSTNEACTSTLSPRTFTACMRSTHLSIAAMELAQCSVIAQNKNIELFATGHALSVSYEVASCIIKVAAEEQGTVVHETQMLCNARHSVILQMDTASTVSQFNIENIESSASGGNQIALIPGGLGGVGILAAVERTHAGVGKVVLSGRSGRSKDTNFYGIAEESKQTAVTVVRCDVASREESSFACVVAQAPRSTSLRAPCIQLLHAGGILRDETIGRQTAGSLGTVMSPKTIGFQRLDDALAYLPIFASVLFSSIAVLLGSMGQANYAAANASLDALAAVQSQTGLPTTSVQWGAWAHGTGGMAVRNKGTLARLERMGIGSLTPEQGLVALIVVLHKQPLIHLDIFTISPFDWGTFLEKLPQEKQTPYESFLDMRTVTRDTNSQSNFDVTIDTEDEIQSDDANSNVQDAIDEITSSVLPLLDFKSKTISEDDPLMENGLDSLGAVELRQTLSSVFKMNLPPTIIFDYPTIGALARFVTIQRSQQSRTKSHFKRR
ncbi:KR domain-containing protein, partial [bacterium]|nr:KR domain-containing protein [bacterium]